MRNMLPSPSASPSSLAVSVGLSPSIVTWSPARHRRVAAIGPLPFVPAPSCFVSRRNHCRPVCTWAVTRHVPPPPGSLFWVVPHSPFWPLGHSWSWGSSCWLFILVESCLAAAWASVTGSAPDGPTTSTFFFPRRDPGTMFTFKGGTATADCASQYLIFLGGPRLFLTRCSITNKNFFHRQIQNIL